MPQIIKHKQYMYLCIYIHIHIQYAFCLQIWLALPQFPTSRIALHSLGTSKCRFKWTARCRHEKSGTLFREFILRMEDLSERVAEDRALLQAYAECQWYTLVFCSSNCEQSNTATCNLFCGRCKLLWTTCSPMTWSSAIGPSRMRQQKSHRTSRLVSLTMWFARRQNHLRLTYEPWQWTTV